MLADLPALHVRMGQWPWNIAEINLLNLNQIRLKNKNNLKLQNQLFHCQSLLDLHESMHPPNVLERVPVLRLVKVSKKLIIYCNL